MSMELFKRNISYTRFKPVPALLQNLTTIKKKQVSDDFVHLINSSEIETLIKKRRILVLTINLPKRIWTSTYVSGELRYISELTSIKNVIYLIENKKKDIEVIGPRIALTYLSLGLSNTLPKFAETNKLELMPLPDMNTLIDTNDIIIRAKYNLEEKGDIITRIDSGQSLSYSDIVSTSVGIQSLTIKTPSLDRNITWRVDFGSSTIVFYNSSKSPITWDILFELIDEKIYKGGLE